MDTHTQPVLSTSLSISIFYFCFFLHLQYYDLFLQHCPWGRPGGGAPNVEVRRKDITAAGLHSTPTVVSLLLQPLAAYVMRIPFACPPAQTTAHRINSLQPCRYNDYFTMQKKCHKNPLAVYHHHHHHPPGAGGRLTHAHSIHHLQESGPRSSTVTICERELPLKPAVSLGHNANGESIHIELKEHPSMSFRNKGHLDIELRYKPSPPCKGKPMLDKIVVNSESEHPLQEKLANQKKKLQAKLEKPVSGGYCPPLGDLLNPICHLSLPALQRALGQGRTRGQAVAQSQASRQHFYEIAGNYHRQAGRALRFEGDSIDCRAGQIRKC